MAGRNRTRERCMLCGRTQAGGSSCPALCPGCAATTNLPRLVTVAQLAALTPGLTEDKIRHYLKRRHENGLAQSGAIYAPHGTNSCYLHLDHFERWFAGLLEVPDSRVPL